MIPISGVDWAGVFKPDTPLLEIFVRGSLMYLGLFVLLRVITKRQTSTMSIADLLLIVLIADAAQNGMADDYKSLPDGLLLVGVLMFWNFAIDWLGYRIRFIGRFVHPLPLPLIKNGRVLRANLRRELMTVEELQSQLREQGVETVANVKIAQMEGDGRVSVIQFGPGEKKGRGPDDMRGV
jgi:uncharacterized membrane protein YcaP (DUF421 family)